MTRVLEFLIALLLVVALFVVVGLLLPGKRSLEHSIETNHPIRQVYDTISSFQRLRDWSPLRLRDPNMEFELVGEERGEGARVEYSSPIVGDGALEIVEAVQDERVVIEAENADYGTGKIHTLEIEEEGRNVVITHKYQVDYGWNLFGRYAGLYVARNIGDDIKLGLGNLAGLIATMPNFDYAKLEIEKVQLEPAHLLYVETTSERNITAVEEAMNRALRDIRQAIEANGLEEAGPPRLITTNFGDETYDFDMAIPVRAAGSAAADDEAEANEGEGVDDEPADEDLSVDVAAEDEEKPDPCAAPLEPLPELEAPGNLSGQVKFGQAYAGCALRADYIGHPAALPLVRDMLRSYAAARGHNIHDRAFEEYLVPVDQAMGGSVAFYVYWPIR